MIELFMHGQHPPTVTNHILHLQQAKLVQSVRPDVNSMPILNYNLGQTFIKVGC